MNERRVSRLLSVLQWTLGLVVIYQACLFMLCKGAAPAFNHSGLPSWVRPALGGVEAVAAVLFLVRPAVIVGGYSLVVIFILAIVVHLLHHAGDASGLLIYAAAALVIAGWQSQQRLGKPQP